jgi:hypothetical protein
MTPNAIRKRLIDTVDVISGLQNRCVSGGRLNLSKALGGSCP